MAPGLMPTSERRRAPRTGVRDTPWTPDGVLRPGQQVIVLDVSAAGARVESSDRMKPGARVELQLQGSARQTVRGRIARCRVVALGPLRYEAAIAFDEPLDGAARLEPLD